VGVLGKNVKKPLGKAEKVNAEIERLNTIFDELDDNVKQTMRGLIQNAAYINICILELQEIINENGYIETYQNGMSQSGVKQSEYVKIHTSYSKILETTLKELVKYAPPAKRKTTLLSALKNV
jgi:hypothetical protein